MFFRPWIVSSALGFFLVVGIQFGVADFHNGIDPTDTNEIIHFESFGLWQKIQLGATSLVNPRVAERARILNSYDLNQRVLEEALIDNSIIVEEIGPQVYRILPRQEAGEISNAVREGAADSSRYKLITRQTIDEPGSEVISWPNLER